MRFDGSTTHGCLCATGRGWRPASGCRLTPRPTPCPAILEAVPYRLSDGTAMRDVLIHPYLAGHGYACVRVDLRGSGESDGLLEDEYAPQEQDDLLEVIAWLAAQPWCTGAVGMIGISWGGFNACRWPHGARRRSRRSSRSCAPTTATPTTCTTRAAACWPTTCCTGAPACCTGSASRRPAAVGERWREMWLERLEATSRWSDTWLAHQRRDDYWKHGSVCEDYAAIEVPGLRGRRLDRRLHQRRAAPAGGPAQAAQGPDRAVGARVPALRDARAPRSASCRRRCAGGTTG